MSKTAGQLKVAVAGFMQRDPSVFSRTVGAVTWDVLLQSMNNARLYAERQIDFELSKCSIQIAATLTGGANLADAKLYGTTTSVSVKKILTPFLTYNNTADACPVNLVSKQAWNERLKRLFAGGTPVPSPLLEGKPLVVVQDGSYLFVAPADSTAISSSLVIYADAIKWLPDYTSAGTENDFMLDFCFDWLMYRSIEELNFFVKEDERVQLSAKLVADSWNAIVKWNMELMHSNVDDVTLD